MMLQVNCCGSIRRAKMYGNICFGSLNLKIYIFIIFGIISRGVFGGDVEIIKRIGQSRGIPGVDYPTYHSIPRTSFSCWQQKYNPGLYADTETKCQVFHSCFEHRQESFLCPIGTTFNQPILSCDYWYSSNCSLAPHFYHLNAKQEEEKVSDIIRYDEPSDIDFVAVDSSSMDGELPVAESQLIERMAELFHPDYDEFATEVSFPEVNFDETIYDRIDSSNEAKQYEMQLQKAGHTPEEEIVYYYDSDSEKQQRLFSDDFIDEQSGLPPEDLVETFVNLETMSDIDRESVDLYLQDKNSRFRRIELTDDSENIKDTNDFSEQKYHDDDGSGYEVEVPMHAEDYFSIDLGSGDDVILESEPINENEITEVHLNSLESNDSPPISDEKEFLFTNENNPHSEDAIYVDESIESSAPFIPSLFSTKISINEETNTSLISQRNSEEYSTTKPHLITKNTSEEYHSETHGTVTSNSETSTQNVLSTSSDKISIDFSELEALNSEQLSDAPKSPDETFNKRASRRLVYVDPVEEETVVPKIPTRKRRPKLILVQESIPNSFDRDLITSNPEDNPSFISPPDETRAVFDKSLSEDNNSYNQNSEFRILSMHGAPEEIYQTEFASSEGQINDAFHEVSDRMLADNQPNDMDLVYSYSAANRIQNEVLEGKGHSIPYTSQANRESSSDDGKLVLELEKGNDYSLASGETGVTDSISGLPHIKTAKGNRELFYETMQVGKENDQTEYRDASEETLVANVVPDHLDNGHIEEFKSHEMANDLQREYRTLSPQNTDEYQHQFTDYYIPDEGAYAPGETYVFSENNVEDGKNFQNNPTKSHNTAYEIWAANVDPEDISVNIEQIRNLPFENTDVDKLNYYKADASSDEKTYTSEEIASNEKYDSLLDTYGTEFPDDYLNDQYRLQNTDKQAKYLQIGDQNVFQDSPKESRFQDQNSAQDNDKINEDNYKYIKDLHDNYMVDYEDDKNKYDNVLISQTSDESQKSSDAKESQKMTYSSSQKDINFIDEMSPKENSKDRERVTNILPKTLYPVRKSPVVAWLRQSFNEIPKKQMKQLQLRIEDDVPFIGSDVPIQMDGYKPVQYVPTMISAADIFVDPVRLVPLSRIGRNLDKSKLSELSMSPGKLFNMKKAKLNLLKKYYKMFNY